MNEMAGVRKKLRQALGQELSDTVWGAPHIQGVAREYLRADSDEDQADSWKALEEGARERLDIWNDGRKEGLRGVQSGTLGGSRDMHEAAARDSGEDAGRLDPWELFSDRTKAMTGAMSALFALTGDQITEVSEFRERVLPGRFLTADEAHALIASCAARTFSPSWFEEWGIPFIGHRARVVDTGPRGEDYNPVDDRMTIRVDPPGTTKMVRYALPREGDPNTRCVIERRSGSVIPIHNYLPGEIHGEHAYPPWLWPGSVVDELYDISVALASSFDWPQAVGDNFSGTRPRSETAAWFVLTGEAPQVLPIDARWEKKRGSTYVSPQWRIQLTIPPWLPEEEVLSALRTLRRQRREGRQTPKTEKPLEVARFVWEWCRADGYHGPPPWTEWLRQWNDEHPGHRIETASNFRTYFLRGDAAVKDLNFGWPNFEHKSRELDTI